jgi:cobalt-zinc-cadmium efflux system protein
VVISWEAIQRFQHPEPVQPLIMFGSATVGIVVNLFIAFGLHKEDDHNLNVRAATLHVMGDVGASVGVIIAGVIILLTGWSVVDPILSVGIALLIAVGAWRILHETADILLEAAPRGISLTNLVEDMKSVHGVQAVHDLHVWSIASGMYALSCHVLIDNLPPSDSSPILQSLTSVLSEKYQISHSTVQFENDAHEGACCGTRNLYCRMGTASEHGCDHDHADVPSVSMTVKQRES